MKALTEVYAEEVVRLQSDLERITCALQQIERLAIEGTREGHIIRDSIQEIATKALKQIS